MVRIHSFDGVRAAKDNGGVTRAGDACPSPSPGVREVDGYTIERHGSTISHTNLHVCAKFACEYFAVLGLIVAVDCREINGVSSCCCPWCTLACKGGCIVARHIEHTGSDIGNSSADTAQ